MNLIFDHPIIASVVSIFILYWIVRLFTASKEQDTSTASYAPKSGNLNAALFSAAENGDLKEVQRLVSCGADVNAKGSSRPLPFDLIASPEMVKSIYALYGKWDNGSVLHAAARSGNLELVQYLVEKGANVNAKDDGEMTVLHYAAETGNQGLVKWLAKQVSDINAKSKKGDMPLDLAARKHKWDVVEALLELGADINAGEGGYFPCLQAIAFFGSLEQVQKLVIDHGANINIKNSLGQTPLHLAVQGGRLNIAQWLVEHGAIINAKGDNDDTVLQHAAHSGNLKLVKWLVEKGLDVNAKDKDGKTPLIFAAENQQRDVVEWLKEHGAK